MSVERPIQVKIGDRTVEAIAFVTSPQRQSLDGSVSERYLEALVRGALQSGLPEHYIASLPSKAK
jgi:hypothetical protein